MKVAYVATASIPSRAANSMQVMKMCQAFVQEGHELTLYVPNNQPASHAGSNVAPDNDALWDHYGIRDRFEIRRLPATSFGRQLDFAFRSVLRARSEGAEVIYTRNQLVALLALWFGTRSICEMHDLPSGQLGMRVFRRLANSKKAIVVAISQALRDALGRAYRFSTASLLLVLPDGVDLERFEDLPSAEVAREMLGVPDKFTVAYAGHLYSGRGIPMLLNLAADLRDVQWLIIGGEPPDIRAYESIACKRRLSNVLFAGFVDNKELPSFLAAADVLTMPYETNVANSGGGDIARFMSPMKLFEYLACGRLIISSDLPALREILSDETALLCRPGDLTAWKTAVVRARTDSACRDVLATNAKRIARRFSWRARVRECVAALSGKQRSLLS